MLAQGRMKWTQQSLTPISAPSAHRALLLQGSPTRKVVVSGAVGRALRIDLSLSFLTALQCCTARLGRPVCQGYTCPT